MATRSERQREPSCALQCVADRETANPRSAACSVSLVLNTEHTPWSRRLGLRNGRRQNARVPAGLMCSAMLCGIRWAHEGLTWKRKAAPEKDPWQPHFLLHLSFLLAA